MDQDKKENIYLLSKHNMEVLINITKALGKVKGKQEILELKFEDHDENSKGIIKEIAECVKYSVSELKNLSVRLEASPFSKIFEELRDFEEKAMSKFGDGQSNALRGLSSILRKINNIEKMLEKQINDQEGFEKEKIKYKWNFKTVLIQSITLIITAAISAVATLLVSGVF